LKKNDQVIKCLEINLQSSEDRNRTRWKYTPPKERLLRAHIRLCRCSLRFWRIWREVIVSVLNLRHLCQKRKP